MFYSIQTLFLSTLLVLFIFTNPSLALSQDKIYKSEGQSFRYETLVQQKDVIWGFDFLSAEEIIFTERQGALRKLNLKTKKVTDIAGAPKVHAVGQGGLLDIRVNPERKEQIFITYSEPAGGKRESVTSLASATIKDNQLVDFKKLFSMNAPTSENIHFGSRIEFDGKGHVWFTLGDRNTRKNVQDLNFHNGKIIRLKLDGSVPDDNPFIKNKSAKPEIWSLGHRSPQGLVRHPVTGDLWEAEMGPRGGDEINLIKPGLNYGWPDATYGREYWGPKIGETHKDGTEQPILHWTPSLSPSAITIYNGDAFPKWKGNMFVANLGSTHLRRLTLEGQKITKQEPLLNDLEYRMRNVRPGVEGFLYLSTDEGQIGRLVPVQ